MRAKSLIVCSVVMGTVLLGMSMGPSRLEARSKQVLTAAKVKQAPQGLDDSLWKQSTPVEVPFEGKERFAGKKATVTAHALYTHSDVFFLFRWKDATHSVTKKSWRFDGQTWSHLKGNEDRLALLFEINRIRNFATKGCAVTCHGPAGAPVKEYKFATATAAEKGDLWHWKAARSDPQKHADDTWLTVAGKKTGRKSDSGKGGDVKNQTEDKSRPRWMHDPARPSSAPGFLLAEETVEIRDYSVFKAGHTLPYRLPKKPTGSRADIRAESRYENGGWTLMLSRALDTGHDDDVAFNPRKKYNVAMALFDDSGDENSYDSEVLSLRFK